MYAAGVTHLLAVASRNVSRVKHEIPLCNRGGVVCLACRPCGKDMGCKVLQKGTCDLNLAVSALRRPVGPKSGLWYKTQMGTEDRPAQDGWAGRQSWLALACQTGCEIQLG